MMQGTETCPVKHIALYGGTFCPIQNAHIRLALFLQRQFKFDEFRFLPNKEPVLQKRATASLTHRLAMLELALAPYKEFMLDRREVNRSTPSFMVDTLDDMRKELGDKPHVISLIIGADNFLNIHHWHDWKRLFTLCNLIVIERPGYALESLPAPLKEQFMSHHLHEINHPSEISLSDTGGFYRCNAGLYEVSSSMVRDLIEAGKDVGAYLPGPVLEYIKTHRLFT